MQQQELSSTRCGTSQVGTIRAVHGTVEFRRAGKWHRGRTGLPVNRKDRMRTSKNGRALLKYCDKSALFLNHGTQVTLVARDRTKVTGGEARQLVPAGKAHHLQTRIGDAFGPDVDVRIRPDGRSVFVAVSGVARVNTSKGSVMLNSSQATVVQKDHPPARPTSVDVPQVTSWTGGLGTWTVLTAGGLLSQPRRIALAPDGTLIVSDQYNHRIVRLSAGGKLLASWTATSASGSAANFISPYGVAVDATGNIYVADEGLSLVQKLSPGGAPLAIVAQGCYGVTGCGDPSQPGVLLGSEGVALDAEGNIYVADTTLNRVQKFSPSGAFLHAWGTNGSGPGQFSLPSAVAVDRSGAIYVADSINNRIQKLSPDGQVLGVWGGTRGSGLGQFYGPSDVTVAPDGNIYVADAGNNRIQEFSPDGHPIQVFGLGGGTRPGEFISPEGVAVNVSGTIYVVDRSNSRIQRYTR